MRPFLTLLLLLAVCARAPGSEPVSVESVDADIRLLLKDKAPAADTGAAVGIVRDGKVWFQRTYGLRDRENGLPVTERTLFSVASTTKAFGALALKLAQSDGKVDLEAPIRRWLPDFQLEPESAAARMSAVDLLSHRSGLPRHDMLWYLTPLTPGEIFARLRYLDPHPSPELGFRKGFLYNNLMYLVAGRLLERTTGEPWKAYLTRRILGPLGMRDSHFSPARFELHPDAARPYLGTRRLGGKVCDMIGPGCGLYASVRDMLLWTRFHLEGGVTADGRRLLSPEAMASLYQKHIPVGPPENETGYALAWVVAKAHGGATLVWHSGSIDGYVTAVAMIPERKLGAVVMINQQGSPLAVEMAMSLLERLYPRPPRDDGPSLAEKARAVRAYFDLESRSPLGCRALAEGHEPAEIATSPEQLAAYRGRYEHPGYGPVTLGEEQGRLRFEYYGHGSRLRRREAERFAVELSIVGVRYECDVALERDARGEPRLLVPFEPQVAPIAFVRRRPDGG